MSAPAVKGPWFDVPAGTAKSQCRSCRADVYWITTPAGKKMPVSCDVPGAEPPAETRDGNDGNGVSHFATCPERETWRKSR